MTLDVLVLASPQDHADSELIWDTDSSLYETDGAGGSAAVEGKYDGMSPNPRSTGVMIQDVTLPGYHDEWEAKRKVCVGRFCRHVFRSSPRRFFVV